MPLFTRDIAGSQTAITVNANRYDTPHIVPNYANVQAESARDIMVEYGYRYQTTDKGTILLAAIFICSQLSHMLGLSMKPQ